ncbi:unnamed protein product [Photorhabdus laumondii subsp. laumondii TTO1]|uniref:Photorhabdus luminescens subsp. laumondii TTO1 complete genome segment 15/17 n=1 Tax=Photorhabdus laumondii subsp. laumondii (strain DSM 15139 / CIP 105565 / TT01) TaxID=243265 RepID=Q7MZF4_PHOLL|nr:unnamed protein product [Photorhabdus laumondii subsp. laumondii TTO1]
MLALSHVPSLSTRLSGVAPNVSVTLLHVRHHIKGVLLFIVIEKFFFVISVTKIPLEKNSSVHLQ